MSIHRGISTKPAYKKLNLLDMLKREFKLRKWLYLMVLPGIAVIFIFNYVPMYGILIAFKKYKVKLGILKSPWVGLEYFQTFFNNPFAIRTIRNTFLLGLYNLLWTFPAPIILAIMFNEVKNAKYKKLVQTVSYYPNFVSTVIIVGMLPAFCASDGLFNTIRGLFNLTPINFLSEARYFRTLYIASGLWQGVGFGSIIYLAALTGIDPTLYDAADIDGAGRLQKIRSITFPHLLPTIIILFILAIGNLFGSDTQKVLLMYSPSTYETADIIGTYTYREGLEGARFEYSTAVGLFQTLVNFCFLLSANLFIRKVSETSLF
ncbi:MAG: ABC transporter permease [Christensenellales bacterium]|jgi:putative aldouronate transport system permease protein